MQKPNKENSYVGSMISLISKSGIRYVGNVEKIDNKNKTLTISNVRMFGTEGRIQGRQIPAQDKVFPRIAFKNADIADLQFSVPVNIFGGSGFQPPPSNSNQFNFPNEPVYFGGRQMPFGYPPFGSDGGFPQMFGQPNQNQPQQIGSNDPVVKNEEVIIKSVEEVESEKRNVPKKKKKTKKKEEVRSNELEASLGDQPKKKKKKKRKKRRVTEEGEKVDIKKKKRKKRVKRKIGEKKKGSSKKKVEEFDFDKQEILDRSKLKEEFVRGGGKKKSYYDPSAGFFDQISYQTGDRRETRLQDQKNSETFGNEEEKDNKDVKIAYDARRSSASRGGRKGGGGRDVSEGRGGRDVSEGRGGRDASEGRGGRDVSEGRGGRDVSEGRGGRGGYRGGRGRGSFGGRGQNVRRYNDYHYYQQGGGFGGYRRYGRGRGGMNQYQRGGYSRRYFDRRNNYSRSSDRRPNDRYHNNQRE